MEGKEIRFGLSGSSLFAVATTGTSCGAVNTKTRGISRDLVMKAVEQATEERQLGFLGVPRVNVLVLNLELDTLEQ